MVVWIFILINMPLFSIIIPTYNRAHTIRRPIVSILAQTFSDWELIIVDDGSTDSTKDVVVSYIDDRIRYIWQENQERSAARNHGIELAKGEWICFQDSDDEYLPQHLDVLKSEIDKNPDVLVFRTGMFIFQNGNLIKTPKFDVSNKYALYPFDAFTTFCFNKCILQIDQFDIRFFNSEDLHLLLRIAALNNIKIIQNYTNIYHYNPSNSGGLNENYYDIHQNKILVFKDLLSRNLGIKSNYLKRKLCLSQLLLLSGSIKYRKHEILKQLKNVWNFFILYPGEFSKLILRILIVKIGEFTKLFSFEERF